MKPNRLLGHDEVTDLDQLLLLDLLGSQHAEEYMARFPLHPHRGMETVTYMLDGRVDHRGSIGNHGGIGPGDVQWTTAGRGIIHEEMPQRTEGGMRGFQLWADPPWTSRMVPPKWRDVKRVDIPDLLIDHCVKVKVIAGTMDDVQGPVHDLLVPVEYLDVRMRPGTVFEHHVPRERHAFAAVFEGAAKVEADTALELPAGGVARPGEGDGFKAIAGGEGARYLLVSGMSLQKPIAWGGPIVMNTQVELEQAFSQIENGTFIKES